MNLKRTITAYVLASALCILPALVIVQLLRAWHINIPTWQAIATLWLLVIGLPSMRYASTKLSATLGHRPPPTLTISDSRQVHTSPLHSLADAIPTIFSQPSPIVPHSVRGAPPPTPGFHVADTFTVTQRHGTATTIIDMHLLHDFLRRSWRRQLLGETAPLSRTWWVDRGRRITRDQYDLLISLLSQSHLLTGRTGQRGSSGRLRVNPDRTIRELQYRLGEMVDASHTRPH